MSQPSPLGSAECLSVILVRAQVSGQEGDKWLLLILGHLVTQTLEVRGNEG